MTKGRILIVYPDEAMGKLIRTHFVQCGYQALWVSHAGRALTQLKAFVPDALILANSDLPENGYDDPNMWTLVKEFDDIERVMVLISSPKNRMIEETFDYRPTYQLLTVPFDPEELELRIRRMIEAQRNLKPRLMLVESDQWVCQYITSHLTEYTIDIFTPDEALAQLKIRHNTYIYKLVLLANELEVGQSFNFKLDQLDAANIPIWELCWKQHIPVIFLCNQHRLPPFPDVFGEALSFDDVIVKWHRSRR